MTRDRWIGYIVTSGSFFSRSQLIQIYLWTHIWNAYIPQIHPYNFQQAEEDAIAAAAAAAAAAEAAEKEAAEEAKKKEAKEAAAKERAAKKPAPMDLGVLAEEEEEEEEPDTGKVSMGGWKGSEILTQSLFCLGDWEFEWEVNTIV